MPRTKIFVLVSNVHKNNSYPRPIPDVLLPVLVAHVGDEKIETNQMALRAPDGTIVGRLLYARTPKPGNPQVWVEWYGTVEAEDWEMET